MRIEWNKELYHYGMPRRSGRYKWGSGKNPYHHGSDAVKSAKKDYKAAKKEASKQQKRYNRYGAIHPVGTISYAVGAKPLGRYGRHVRKNLDTRYSKWEDSLKSEAIKQKAYKDIKAGTKLERKQERINAKNERKEARVNAKNEKALTKQREELNKIREKQKKQLRLTDDDKKMLISAREYKKIYDYKNQFTDKEMDNILSRADKEKDLSKIKNQEIAEGSKIVRDVLKPYGQAATAAAKSIRKIEEGGEFAAEQYYKGRKAGARVYKKIAK